MQESAEEDHDTGLLERYPSVNARATRQHLARRGAHLDDENDDRRLWIVGCWVPAIDYTALMWGSGGAAGCRAASDGGSKHVCNSNRCHDEVAL